MWNSCLLHESDTGVILVHCSQQRGLRMSLYLVIGRCMMSVLERGSQGLLLSLRLSPPTAPVTCPPGNKRTPAEPCLLSHLLLFFPLRVPSGRSYPSCHCASCSLRPSAN